jgi:SulP family sulfate permease
MTARLRTYLPFLNWPRPTARLLRGEAWAGLTVGLMVIPQGVAYAVLAGMPPVTGIYAALLPALVAGLFSASPRQSVGPTALCCLLVSAGLSGLAEPGSAEWVRLAIWLALLSGLLQLALGGLRFGWLLNLVNAPVLAAFTQAAALLIIASQLPALTGWQGPGHWQQDAWQAWHVPSMVFGLGTLALLLAARRLRPSLPTVLLAVIAAAGVSRALGFEAAGGRVIGTLPAGLPELALPGLPSLDTLRALLLPTLVITLVSFLETASSAKADNAQLGKIAAGLSGAFPTSSSFSRSALTLYAGARSGWATVFSVGVVLLALWLFIPVLRHVPQAVLAAVVVAAVLGLIKPGEFLRLWRMARVEACIAGATLLITLAAAPQLYWGVLSGVLMSLSYFLYQRLHPRIIEVGLHPDGSLRDRHLWKLPPLAPKTYAMRMDAALDFAAASEFERNVLEFLAAHPEVRQICLFAQPINHIDATGADVFLKLSRQLQAQGILLHISGMKLPVEKTLLQAGWQLDGAGHRLYRTEAEALGALAADTQSAQD